MVSNTRKSNGTGIGVSIVFGPSEVMDDFTLGLWAKTKRVLASLIVSGAVWWETRIYFYFVFIYFIIYCIYYILFLFILFWSLDIISEPWKERHKLEFKPNWHLRKLVTLIVRVIQTHTQTLKNDWLCFSDNLIVIRTTQQTFIECLICNMPFLKVLGLFNLILKKSY